MRGLVSTQALWYLTRGSGLVTLLMLSATVVVGLSTARRAESERWPRFAVGELHRRLALTSVVFLALHVLTAVTDPFAPIGWLSAVVPFVSAYRPIWLGFGTLSVDLFVAILATSLVRRHLSERLWRAVHWLAYLSWPVAVFHTLGTGSDVREGWFLALVALCIFAVVVALVARLGHGFATNVAARLAGGGAALVLLAGVGAFAALGPLRPNWAARSGTPVAQLGASAHRAAGAAVGTLPNPPYEAAVAGRLTTTALAGGAERIVIELATSGSIAASVALTLVGTPAAGGGVSVERTSATYGPSGSPTLYTGSAVAVEGSRVTLALADAAGARLSVVLALNLSGSSVSGTLRAESGAAAALSPPASGGEREGADGGDGGS